jgi:hypothetical protein
VACAACGEYPYCINKEVSVVSWRNEQKSWPPGSIHLAAFRNDIGELKRLIALGVDPNLGDEEGVTPLHVAAREQSAAAVRALLDMGAAVDPQDWEGWTPLGVSLPRSINGDGETVTALLIAGADPNRPNNAGNTPRELAALLDAYHKSRLLDLFEPDEFASKTDEIEQPVAEALVRWRTADQGGRPTGPPTTAVFVATAVFGIDSECESVNPGWLPPGNQVSILLQKTAQMNDGRWYCVVDFPAPDRALAHLRKDAKFLLVQGCRIVASAELTLIVE